MAYKRLQHSEESDYELKIVTSTAVQSRKHRTWYAPAALTAVVISRARMRWGREARTDSAERNLGVSPSIG
jgi:hypothetical protein